MGQEIMKVVHWDVNKVLSKQRNINFIIGQRGVGKTFTTLLHCIKRALKYGEEFMYMRRYEAELSSAREIMNPFKNYFEGVQFKVVGKNIYANDKIIGYICALSTSHKMKGTQYPNLKYLIYDEFLAEVGATKELKGEIFKFYNTLETLFRLRDFTVFMLANAVTFECCYKYELGLKLPLGNAEFWYHPHKSILVQLVKNEPYEDAKINSPLGKIIKGTTFAEYAVYNKFYGDNYSFIKKRSSTYFQCFTLGYNNKIYGLYVSRAERGMILDEAIGVKYPDYQAPSIEQGIEGVKMVKTTNSPVIKYIQTYLYSGMLFYQNLQIKTELFPFITKIM